MQRSDFVYTANQDGKINPAILFAAQLTGIKKYLKLVELRQSLHSLTELKAFRKFTK